MDPIADGTRPAHRHAHREAERGAEKITGGQQAQRGENAFGEADPIVDHDFQQRLRWREERHRKQAELRRNRLPGTEKQCERKHPWRDAAYARQAGKTTVGKCGTCEHGAECAECSGEVAGVIPVGSRLVGPEGCEQGDSDPYRCRHCKDPWPPHRTLAPAESRH
jgi:hypothetical protein